MSRLSLILIFTVALLPCIQGQQNISWSKKGNGFWHVASNWDLNRLPNAMDTVFILHDSVIINGMTDASAKKIVVGAVDSMGVGLGVLSGGSLHVMGSSGHDTALIIVNASVFNAGKMEVGLDNPSIAIDTTSFFLNRDTLVINSVSLHTGINNANILINEVTGVIKIDGGFYGVFNQATVDNDGQIHISNFSNTGLYNRPGSNLIQNGQLNILDSGGIGVRCAGSMISNGGGINVENVATGMQLSHIAGHITQLSNTDSIFINQAQFGMILGASTAFDNIGVVSIHNTMMDALMNAGNVVNQATGVINLIGGALTVLGYRGQTGSDLQNFGVFNTDQLGAGLSNNSSSTIVNYSNVTMTDCITGMENLGSISNLAGLISITDSTFGLLNQANTSVFINDLAGQVSFHQSSKAMTLMPGSTFENRTLSDISSLGSIDFALSVELGAQLINDGTMNMQ